MYQQHDKWINYQEYDFDIFRFRGPLPNLNKKYASFLGAAQTYGRYANNPFPSLVCDNLGLECFNVSYGGAGVQDPMFYHYKVLETINRGEFCVLQIMSGRSVSTNDFQIIRGQDGYIGDNAYRSTAEYYWKKIFETKTISYIKDTRNTCIKNFHEGMEFIISRINVPLYIFYFSSTPYKDLYKNAVDFSNYKTYLGNFPQLLRPEDIEIYDGFIECSSNRGLPQLLPEPVTDGYQESLGEKPLGCYNNYYPSPEMHVDAANVLLSKIK